MIRNVLKCPSSPYLKIKSTKSTLSPMRRHCNFKVILFFDLLYRHLKETGSGEMTWKISETRGEGYEKQFKVQVKFLHYYYESDFYPSVEMAKDFAALKIAEKYEKKSVALKSLIDVWRYEIY